jgi:hypothetical protein
VRLVRRVRGLDGQHRRCAVSEFIKATCPHGRGAFIWLPDGPDDDGTYPWVHDSTMIPGHMIVCELMPGATPEEAGEACARCGCDLGGHEKEPDPYWVRGRERGPCNCGTCPGMVYRTTQLGRELLAGRAA